MPLTVETGPIQGCPHAAMIWLSGGDDAHTDPRLVPGVIEGLLAEGKRRLVVDLSKLKYFSSGNGIATLVKCADALKQRGGGLALVGVPPKVKVVLEMLGLCVFFPIAKNLDAALEALPVPGPLPPRLMSFNAERGTLLVSGPLDQVLVDLLEQSTRPWSDGQPSGTITIDLSRVRWIGERSALHGLLGWFDSLEHETRRVTLHVPRGPLRAALRDHDLGGRC